MRMQSCCIMRLLLVLCLFSISLRLYVNGEDGLYWEKPSTRPDRYRTCKYVWLLSRIWNISGYLNWDIFCLTTAASFDVSGYQHMEYAGADWCHGNILGEYGRFHAVQQSCPKLEWGSWKDDGCAFNGVRRYSSILWGIDWGTDWYGTCLQTEANANGLIRSAPATCSNTGVNIWGIVYNLDSSCCYSRPASQPGRSLLQNKDECVLGPNGGGGSGNPPFPNNNPFTLAGYYVDTDEILLAQLKRSTLKVVEVLPEFEFMRLYFVLTAAGDNNTLTTVSQGDLPNYQPSQILRGFVFPWGYTPTSGNVIQVHLTVRLRDVPEGSEREFYVSPLLEEGQEFMWGFNPSHGLWHAAIIRSGAIFTFRGLRLAPSAKSRRSIASIGTLGPGPGYVVAWVTQIGSSLFNLYVYFQSEDGSRPACTILQHFAG